MEPNRLKKRIFVPKVFQDIPKENQIESLLKLRGSLKHVVADHSAALAQIMLKPMFVQVKTRHRSPIRFFNLPLQQALSTADFRYFACSGDQILCELA